MAPKRQRPVSLTHLSIGRNNPAQVEEERADGHHSRPAEKYLPIDNITHKVWDVSSCFDSLSSQSTWAWILQLPKTAYSMLVLAVPPRQEWSWHTGMNCNQATARSQLNFLLSELTQSFFFNIVSCVFYFAGTIPLWKVMNTVLVTVSNLDTNSIQTFWAPGWLRFISFISYLI